MLMLVNKQVLLIVCVFLFLE